MTNLKTALNETLPIVLTDLESAMANAKTGQEYLDLQTLYLFLCEQENDKAQNCNCGIDESGNWSETVFDRFGCDCE